MARNETVQPEVKAIRLWIEEEVVAKGICPPLVVLLQRYRDEQGRVNWNELSQELEIESFQLLKGDVVLEVARAYTEFVLSSLENATIISKVFILPDFKTNKAYDAFMAEVKKTAYYLLLVSPENQVLAQKIFKAAALEENSVISPGEIDKLNTMQIAVQLFEGAFNATYFYGQELSRKDLEGFAGQRGPKERQLLLSRAPHYAFQVVNRFLGKNLSPNLDKTKVHERNTKISQEDTTDGRLKRMRRYNKGK